MQRLLSFCLFAVTLLPLLAPMISAEAEAQDGVPVCCRRGGAHHCMGGMAVAGDGVAQVRGPRVMCPYQQRAVTAVHHEQMGIVAAAGSVVVGVRAPGVVAQAECLWRISFDRSRQKRGPPSLNS
jgi:hypothetical protein